MDMEKRHTWCFQLDILYGNLHNCIIVAEHTHSWLNVDTETEVLHRTEEEKSVWPHFHFYYSNCTGTQHYFKWPKGSFFRLISIAAESKWEHSIFPFSVSSVCLSFSRENEHIWSNKHSWFHLVLRNQGAWTHFASWMDDN